MRREHAILTPALLTCLLASCTPASESGSPGGVAGKADDGQEGLTLDATDPRFVFLRRLDPASTDAPDVQEQPFSHRSRRWHVYPFTSYGAADYRITLQARDPRMHDRAAMWLFGPRRAAGSWGPGRRVRTDDGGKASLRMQSDGYAQYALVVGPRPSAGFLPRYPGRHVRVSGPDGATHRGHIEVQRNGDAFLVVEQARHRIVNPVTSPDYEPGRDDGQLWVQTDGALQPYVVQSWIRSTWVESTRDRELRVAMLNEPHEGHVQLVDPEDPAAGGREHLVVEALGPRAETVELVSPDTEPVLLRLVPRFVQQGQVHLRPDPACESPHGHTGPCRQAVVTDDSGQPQVLSSDHVEPWRPLYVDFEEPSAYNLDLRCEGTCAPELEPPEHPVFVAPDVNTPTGPMEELTARAREQGWADRLQVGAVPAHASMQRRAEHLRRGLTGMLERMADRESSRAAVRLNVLAHAMAGLDASLLLSGDKYNAADCGARNNVCRGPDGVGPCCTDASGQAVPCCPDGVPWRARIASLTVSSLPHCGSPFADWALERLSGGRVSTRLQRTLFDLFGLDSRRDRQDLIQTLYTMAQAYCTDGGRSKLQPPHPARNYDWTCATTPDTPCPSGPPEADHRPVRAGDGRWRLPAPDRRATLFEWSSQSCLTGTCGQVLDPALSLAFEIGQTRGRGNGLVKPPQGGHAPAGIFMGSLPESHALRHPEAPSPARTRQRTRWTRHWLTRLARSGY